MFTDRQRNKETRTEKITSDSLPTYLNEHIVIDCSVFLITSYTWTAIHLYKIELTSRLGETAYEANENFEFAFSSSSSVTLLLSAVGEYECEGGFTCSLVHL